MSASTSTYPLDTVVYITDYIGGVEYQASGVLIAPDEVLTASHMVYQSGVGVASTIEVSAGYEDGSTPYGTVAGTAIHYNAIDDANDEISNADSQNDFAVIHLATPITTGTMELGDGFAGGVATISGYPASYDGALDDKTENLSKNQSYSLLDGTALGPGSSGGPVWIEGANGTAEVVGLVSSGSGRQGYFVQLTAADVAQIDAWVAADNGTVTTGTGTGTVSGGETVPGAGGAVVTMTYPTATASVAGALLGQISADVAAGSMVAEAATPAAGAPALPAGELGELVVSQSQYVAVAPPYQAVVDNATGSSTVALSSGANISVAAAGAPFELVTGTASGTLVGGSDGTVFIAPSGGGAWDVALGGGANTIVAMAGNDTIAAGDGANLLLFGAGAFSVASAGTDTVVGGSGSLTVSAAASSNHDLVFGVNAALTFLAGSAASTVVGGTGGATVAGGAGPLLYFGTGATSYLGAGAADTVIGGSGGLIGNGDGGNVLMFGGGSGGNLLSTGSGSSTLIGAGDGDVLTATGNSFDVLAAGAGAETLNGAAASGSNVFFGGSGSDVIAGGSGNDAIVAGTGNDTLSGGGGVNGFIFENTGAAASDVVTDFSEFRDFVMLPGLSSTQLTAVENSQTQTSGGVQIALPDGTHVTFTGVTTLNTFSFA